jgi:hypothetical protein
MRVTAERRLNSHHGTLWTRRAAKKVIATATDATPTTMLRGAPGVRTRQPPRLQPTQRIPQPPKSRARLRKHLGGLRRAANYSKRPYRPRRKRHRAIAPEVQSFFIPSFRKYTQNYSAAIFPVIPCAEQVIEGGASGAVAGFGRIWRIFWLWIAAALGLSHRSHGHYWPISIARYGISLSA